MHPEESIAYQLGRMFGTIVLGLLLVGGVAFFIVAVVKACTKKTRGWIVSSVVMGVVGLLIVASTGTAFVVGVTRALAERGKVTKELTTPDGKHRILVPGSWRVSPELNREAQIGAAYPQREQYVLVFVERKLDIAMSLGDYAKATADNMVAKLEDGVQGKLTESTVAERPATRRRLTGRMKGLQVALHHTCVDMPDHLVQVLCWTLASRETSAVTVFDKIAASFSTTGKVFSRTEQVHSLIIELLGTDKAKLKDASRLKEDLGADELDHVELVMAVEEEFGVSVSDEEAEKWKTVGDVTRWVEASAKLSAPTAAPKAN